VLLHFFQQPMQSSCRRPHVSCSESQSEAGEDAPTTAGTPSCSCSDTSLNAEFMMGDTDVIAIDRRRSGPGPGPGGLLCWPSCHLDWTPGWQEDES
jgi:hypothetical protein